MKDAIFVPERFSHRQFWRDVLRHWCLLLGQYEPEGSGEAGFDFWIATDPLIDLLASAASLLPDGWSRESRNSGQQPRSKLLGLGQGAAAVIVAARIYWVAEPFATARAAVVKKLDEANGSLQNTEPQRPRGIPVSVCYAIPEFDGSRAMAQGLNALSNLARWAKSESLATATHITVSSKSTTAGETEYPGVLLVAREETWNESPFVDRKE